MPTLGMTAAIFTRSPILQPHRGLDQVDTPPSSVTTAAIFTRSPVLQPHRLVALVRSNGHAAIIGHDSRNIRQESKGDRNTHIHKRVNNKRLPVRVSSGARNSHIQSRLRQIHPIQSIHQRAKFRNNIQQPSIRRMPRS